MFTDTKAYSGFAVTDIQEARNFYEQTLWATNVHGTRPAVASFWQGGRDTLVYPAEDANPASYTILNFDVNNIDEAVS